MGSAQGTATVITTKTGQTRRFRSKQERRQIVEETLKPGASVSRVARAHDVNANQLFRWRREYRKGLLERAPGQATALLPVKIAGAIDRSLGSARRGSQTSTVTGAGTIDIDL